MVGSHPAAIRAAPLADGSAEPPAEGIRKDTNGPDQASDTDQDSAHLPGRILVLTDLDVPAPGLGHGPHLLSGKDTECSGGGRRGRPHQHATQTTRPPTCRRSRGVTGAPGRGRWYGPSDPMGHGGRRRPWQGRPPPSTPSENEDGRAGPRPRSGATQAPSPAPGRGRGAGDERATSDLFTKRRLSCRAFQATMITRFVMFIIDLCIDLGLRVVLY